MTTETKHDWVLLEANIKVTLRDYEHPAYRDIYVKEAERYEVFAYVEPQGVVINAYRGDDMDAAQDAYYKLTGLDRAGPFVAPDGSEKDD